MNVRGDATRLQQIVANLINNAVKFTPKGGRIGVTLDAHDRSARVIVVDTGVGISPDFLEHVFDRFRQADGSTTRRHGGLGRGLREPRGLRGPRGGRAQLEGAALLGHRGHRPGCQVEHDRIGLDVAARVADVRDGQRVAAAERHGDLREDLDLVLVHALRDRQGRIDRDALRHRFGRNRAIEDEFKAEAVQRFRRLLDRESGRHDRGRPRGQKNLAVALHMRFCLTQTTSPA